MTAMIQKPLSLCDYQLISQLSFVAKRRIAGLVTGEQRSPVIGGGIEFADYREYQPGDDIRQIDWAVFLRLRRLLVKLCAEEKELTVMLLLDNSLSMQYGEPEKLRVAYLVATLLAGVAIQDGNRVGVLSMGAKLNQVLAPERGQASLANVIRAIDGLRPVATVDPVGCVREFATLYGRKCMVVMLSDLLYPEWPQVIKGLAASGCDGYVVQVLCPEELHPEQLGEMTLVDSETAHEVPLHIGLDQTLAYRRELAKYLKEVRGACHRVGLGNTMISSDTPLVKVLNHDLRQGGLLC